MILPCSCTHLPQDTLHGSGQRVCNPTDKRLVVGMTCYRCTICRKDHFRRTK